MTQDTWDKVLHELKKAGFEVLQSSPESLYRFLIKLFSRNICLLVKKSD